MALLALLVPRHLLHHSSELFAAQDMLSLAASLHSCSLQGRELQGEAVGLRIPLRLLG